MAVTSADAGQIPRSGGRGGLVPLGQLIRGTPGAHPVTSIGELRNGAFETDGELDAFLAFVPCPGTRTLPEPPAEAVVFDADVASRSFRGWLVLRLAARLVGTQPILTFVTVGELAQWTKLRRWGPRNLAMPGSWLAGKPVTPGGKAVAATWGGLSAAAIQRGRPRPASDTWVAACCRAYQLPLATLNLKDFRDFAEHHGLRPLEP